MAHLLDILLIGPLLLAGLAMFGLTRDGGWWQAPLARLNREVNGEATAALPAAPLRLGPYTLDSKIGEGAMGEVYRAWSSAAGAWHALKLLPRHASPSERRRFEKEARLGALVRHPNTVSIIEQAEERQGTCYYVMELLEGTNLQQLVEREGPQPPARVARILGQLAAALGEMHVQGLVHRDIKPDNVLLTGGERELCKLIDFGLVEHVGALAQGQPEGALIGTPLYISPEAIVAPTTVGPRSDLYGLGAVGYFLLRGEPVFRGNSLIEVCCHHLHSTPEPLRLSPGDAAPGDAGAAELERIVLDCLAKAPADRPESAAEVARRLARCSEPGCLQGRRTARGRPSRRAEVCCPPRAAECPIAA
jgi:serine/threonine protein kinase